MFSEFRYQIKIRKQNKRNKFKSGPKCINSLSVQSTQLNRRSKEPTLLTSSEHAPIARDRGLRFQDSREHSIKA